MRRRIGDVLMRAAPSSGHQKLPPYFLFDADTGAVLAGPFDRVANAMQMARSLAQKLGVKAWHERTETSASGEVIAARYPII